MATMTPSIPSLELQLRRQVKSLIDVPTQMQEMFEFIKHVRDYSPLFQPWLLSGETKEEALMYDAFDDNGPTTAALAVLSQESKDVTDIRSISLWNGAEKGEEGASISSRVSVLGRPDAVSFDLRIKPEVKDWQVAVGWVKKAVEIWHPLFATFGPFWYSEHRVFQDRPGASWMIYLPRALTTSQIPEARALVPVMSKDKKPKQLGTIVVSVIDESFSDENPEHVKLANAIETRMVDQDLLPLYKDL